DAIESAHVENDAAGERHRLPVVTRTAAAHRQRHALFRAGRGGAEHLVLVARSDDEIGTFVVEERLQDRREPEEVAALQLERCRVVGDRDTGELAAQRAEAVFRQGFHRRAVSKPSTSPQSSTKAAACRSRTALPFSAVARLALPTTPCGLRSCAFQPNWVRPWARKCVNSSMRSSWVE